MSFKKIAVLAIILAVLGSLYYISENTSKSRHKEAPPAFLPGFDKSRTALITIKSPGKDACSLQLDNGTWAVSVKDKTWAADTAAVDKALDAAAAIRQETVASKNPKNFDALDVSEGKGVEVKIDDAAGKALAHFFIGKNGPDIFSTYLRAQGSDTVILAGGILKGSFDRTLKDWRDKTICSLNKDTIIHYAVAGDNGTFAMQKDDKGVWQVEQPRAFPANKDTADKAVSAFAGLKAADFPEGALAEFKLDAPVKTISVNLKDGTKAVLLVGKDKNAFQVYVKLQDRDTVYVIEKYELDNLCPALNKLKEQKTETKKSDNATK